MLGGGQGGADRLPAFCCNFTGNSQPIPRTPSYDMLEKIGPYKFIGVLGRGGMGTVFKGEHEETGEIHAVKVLAPNYSQEPHFRARFESEIQALIKLDHPNIVRLISFGQASGNMFFAMEMVDGMSLFEVQRSGHRFTPPQCLAIAKDVCKGLKHAHDRGIIHRDLKPGNLMMTKERVVKLTDFGIAKSYGSSQNTGNNILGTMDFMSPEQAKGEPVTAKSDIYSLGTVIFTLLAGKPPFTANSIEESFRNLTRVAAPYVSSVVPEVPHEVDHLIRRMMEKKPEKRLATAQATLHQINQAQQQLKNYSEAKTAQHPPLAPDSGSTSPATQGNRNSRSQTKSTQHRPSKSPKVPGISEPQPPNSAGEKTCKVPNAADKTQRLSLPKTSFIKSKSGESGAHEDAFGFETTDKEPAPTEIDYFNTVTDEERETITQQPDLHRSQGALGLGVGLLGVIVVAAVGTWFATRSPTADELFAQIQQHRTQPHHVIQQTQQFIALYPDDERFKEVVAIDRVGNSIDFYHDLVNKLSVRARIPGESRMTEIEDQFHDIVRLADDDMKAADAKMAAFIIVHGGNENLDPRDKDCVLAAQGFRLKQSTSDDTGIEQRVANINAAVERAQQMAHPLEAMKLYRSLIRLHETENWGGQESLRVELLSNIRQHVNAIEVEQKAIEAKEK